MMAFLASKSSFTVSPYQLIFPSNFPFNFVTRALNSSVWVISRLRKADSIARLTASYFCLLMLRPRLPKGCFVSTLSSAIGSPFPHFLLKTVTQFVSQVLPPSVEKACSQRWDVGVMSSHRKRTLIGSPLNVSSA
jgi:hypothetical protein